MRPIWLILGCLVTSAPGCGGGDDGCRSDLDCPPGRYCRAGACGFDCAVDHECPAGFRCTERGRCEPGCVKTNAGVELCDGLDNDCDGLTDEDWPELGSACRNGTCPEGLWVCAEDGRGTLCDGRVPAADDSECNGVDDDCDGQTDEDALPRDCPLQQGVCQGARQVCLGAAGYGDCDYGPLYTPGRDDVCDTLDNDCDGQTDEDAAPLLVPEAGELAQNGLDDNCNGLVDEPGGVMVRIPGHPIWIDSYELTVFERPDCSGARYGEAGDDYPADWPAGSDAGRELYACSLPGLVPSAHLSWHQARRACQAQGKRLCSLNEHGSACNGGGSTYYPYGWVFAPGGCNDALHGAGRVLPAGEKAGCTAGNGTFDMSGNLAEWLSDHDLQRPGAAYVGGYGFACVICFVGLDCLDCIDGDPDHDHIIRKISDCDVQRGEPYESFPLSAQRDFIGARCCLDGPP